MTQVLVDTSVWIRFLSGREPFASRLDALLEQEQVLAHDMVYGELLMGDSGRGPGRAALLKSYALLPRAHSIAHDEIIELVVSRRIHGLGIGWIDAHLLASTLVSGAALWTADESLRAVAQRLRIEWS